MAQLSGSNLGRMDFMTFSAPTSLEGKVRGMILATKMSELQSTEMLIELKLKFWIHDPQPFYMVMTYLFP